MNRFQRKSGLARDAQKGAVDASWEEIRTNRKSASLPRAPLCFHKTLSHQNTGLHDSSLEFLGRTLTAGVCWSNVPSHFFDHGEELGVF